MASGTLKPGDGVGYIPRARIGRTFRRPNGKVEYTIKDVYRNGFGSFMWTEYLAVTQDGAERRFGGSQLRGMIEISTLLPRWW